MKKCLSFLIVVMLFPVVFYGNGTRDSGYEDVVDNSVISKTGEVPLLNPVSGVSILIESYSDLVKDSDGRIITNTVQDILGNRQYKSFNKGFKRFETITIYPSNETESTEAVVLFNLDIYSYITALKDPVTDINGRIEYSEKTFLSYPLVLRVNLKELESALSEKLGHPAKGRFYYLEPDSPGSDSGKWYPVSNLKEQHEIDYTVDGNGIVTVTIYRWPKDDRVHVGS